MNICLIRCPSPFLIEDHMLPPLGLMAVGTCLKQAGHRVTITDEVAGGFDAYGFGPTTPEYSYALKTKGRLPSGAKMVIGGPFATLQPQVCIDDGWGCVVVGDGEVVSSEAFTGNSQVIFAEERPLDEYPIIDRSLVNLDEYVYYIGGRRSTTIMTSKGCPYNCGFCCKNHCSVRLRSAPRVIDEIEYLHGLGYRALMYSEDIFIINRKRAEEVFQRMKELDIISRCLVRADVIVKYGPDFVKMMADCGCVEVGIGIESGSDKILKVVNKRESVSTIKKGIRLLKEHGISVKGFLIIGLPSESYETLDETRRFLDESELDDIDCKIFQPYPGSPIWDNKENYNIDWDDTPLEDQFYKGRPGEYFGSIRTSHLTNSQIVEQWISMEGRYKHG